jgi:tripartite-type tricarboxylate transporter receptor subunit TctC
MKRWILAAAIGSIISSVSGVCVQAESARLSKIVVPYGAGGGVDAFARPLATVLGEAQGQRVIIDNRGGAGGTIGVNNASQSPPDGTVLLAGGVHQPMAEALYPNRGYQIDHDFIPLAITAIVPNVLVVPDKSPFTNLSELLAEAKSQPGKLTYCSSGNGTSQHIIAEMFKRDAGVEIVHVPYRGTAAALQDLVAGVCDMMFDGLGTSAPQIEGKRLRALAVTTAKRSPHLKEVPTLKEAGGPPLDVSTWYALWAVQGTSPDTVAKLREMIKTALQNPSVKQVWEQQGALVPPVADSAIVKFVQDETAVWIKTVTSLKIRAD